MGWNVFWSSILIFFLNLSCFLNISMIYVFNVKISWEKLCVPNRMKSFLRNDFNLLWLCECLAWFIDIQSLLILSTIHIKYLNNSIGNFIVNHKKYYFVMCVDKNLVRDVWGSKNAGFSEPKWYVRGILCYFRVSMQLLLKFFNT